MKNSNRWCKASAAAALLLVAASSPAATVTVDPGASWLGYMNVSDLPANGGAFQFGSGWGWLVRDGSGNETEVSSSVRVGR